MDSVHHGLTLDSLISVFSFLDEEDLIKVSCVCKDWHEAAETQWLWRKMSLRRWGFCNLGGYTWKKYYLHRSKLELGMKSGRSGGDYTCKSLRGHTGRIVGFSYLVSNSSLQDIWNSEPIICSASTDGTVKAWDIYKGVSLWSSSAQNPQTCIVTDPQQCVAMTSDGTGVISAWQGRTGALVSSFSSGSSPCTMLPFNKDQRSFLMVGTTSGLLLVLNSPVLSEVSRHVVCDSFRLNLLLSSPDQKWMLAASKENSDSGPKVFWSQSVCRAADDEDGVLSARLPVGGCSAAAFLPSQPARVAVLHSGGSLSPDTLSVFDLSLKTSRYKQELQAQQVESFRMELNWRNADVTLRARGNDTVLLTDGNDLKVYTLKGFLISSFKDHARPIVSFCVDDFRVVTASRDLSLRVLTWGHDGDKGPELESRYHLLGGSHTMSRGFTDVACDYASVVASVESVNGSDILKAYVFHA